MNSQFGHRRISGFRLQADTTSEPYWTTPPRPIRIGISSCLLGQEVRFDGGHKRDQFLVDTLGQQVEWVPVCPEVEMGLGTPRETLRLVKAQGRHDSVPHGDDQDRHRSHRWDEPMGGPASR